MYVYLSQTWGSDGHFDMLKWSKGGFHIFLREPTPFLLLIGLDFKSYGLIGSLRLHPTKIAG